MNTSQSPITILGCGSYGTALAISFSRNGSPTYLWGHNPDHIHQMQQERQNRRFLPDIEFPESLYLELDLKTALEQSKDILIAVSYTHLDVYKRQPLLMVNWKNHGIQVQ